MAYKQEPCPLCGRNMTAIETHPGRGELYCVHCDLTIGGDDAKTPEELISLMDGSEHRRLKAENAKLRELVKDLHALAGDVLPERKSDYITICSVESCLDYCSRTMPAIEQRMRELGVEL